MARLLVDISVRDHELRAMRIRLSVKYKDRLIRDIELRSPQTAVFGRQSMTGNADHQFEDDRLSRRHFQIAPKGKVWMIEDIGSRHGTFVNDLRVDTVALKPNDVIRAGKCEFTVQVYGSDSTEELTVIDDSDGGRETPALARAGRWKIPASIEQGDSGRTFVHGDFAQVKTPSELILGLRQSEAMKQVWLMIDSSRLGTPLPTPLAEKSIEIIDWLGPDYAIHASPRLVGLNDVPAEAWNPVVDAAWGQDAVVVLFGKLDRDQTLAAIRKAARRGTALAGVFWPSVLHYILLTGKSDVGEQFHSCCTGVLMEFADLPEKWLLVGQPDLAQPLRSLGMRITEAAVAQQSP